MEDQDEGFIDAEDIAAGVYSGMWQLVIRLFSLWLMGMTAVILWNLLPFNYDDTDSWPRKSGASVIVDARTGCEYLSAKGGMTPRMDGQGKHICGVLK